MEVAMTTLDPETLQMLSRFGRPRKTRSDALLIKKMQLALAKRDIEMIAEMMKISGIPTMSQIIRDAVREKFLRMKAEQ
jgi:hypothetical protein